MWASACYDITFTRLREPGWRSADIELAVDRDGFDIDELAAGRPEDFEFESVPSGDDFTGDRGALSLAPECSSGAPSLTAEDPHGPCSLTEPTHDAADLGDAFER